MKQIILIRQDLKMPKGKACGQVAHASIGACRNASQDVIEDWFLNHDQKKIILKVKNKVELFEYIDKCFNNDLKYYIVKNTTDDKWKDEITCIGIGPAEDEVLDIIFGDLKLL